MERELEGVGGDVIECIFMDTMTNTGVTGNTKDETPVCNMTDKAEEGNRCYCCIIIW